MISILVEPSYSGSVWCQNMLKGLESGLKYKRIPYQYVSSLTELGDGCEYLYVIGSVPDWIRNVLTACNRMGIHPILLSNQSDQRFPADYSAVCSDMMLSMKCLVSTLNGIGKTRIALYGINPDSAADGSRQLAYRQAMLTQPGEHVFYNRGSLDACFRDFFPNAGAYDAVICANDFAAISLIRHLTEEAPAERDRLTVIGCAETRLTAFYSRYVQSVRIRFQDYGNAAVSLLETLRRSPFLSRIVMTVRWDFDPGGQACEGNRSALTAGGPELPATEDRFYQDGELDEMLRIEQILNEADELDGKIMGLLMAEAPNEAVAEQCFVNVSTVKYRIRKMSAAARVSSKRELIRLLKKYIPLDP